MAYGLVKDIKGYPAHFVRLLTRPSRKFMTVVSFPRNCCWFTTQFSHPEYAPSPAPSRYVHRRTPSRGGEGGRGACRVESNEQKTKNARFYGTQRTKCRSSPLRGGTKSASDLNSRNGCYSTGSIAMKMTNIQLIKFSWHKYSLEVSDFR